MVLQQPQYSSTTSSTRKAGSSNMRNLVTHIVPLEEFSTKRVPTNST